MTNPQLATYILENKSGALGADDIARVKAMCAKPSRIGFRCAPEREMYQRTEAKRQERV